jgi:hypothetical protein
MLWLCVTAIEIECRNQAIIALTLLTSMWDTAMVSLKWLVNFLYSEAAEALK